MYSLVKSLGFLVATRKQRYLFNHHASIFFLKIQQQALLGPATGLGHLQKKKKTCPRSGAPPPLINNFFFSQNLLRDLQGLHEPNKTGT